MSNYSFHRYANLFPMMMQDEFNSLIADIQERGLLEPVVLFQGQILDGRNRFLACEKLGIEARTKHFTGSEEQALNAVLSWNFERRHLTSSQKAAIAVEIVPLFDALEEQAKQRQRESIKERDDQGRAIPVSQKIDQLVNSNQNKTTHKAAVAMGTNRQYVTDAKKLQESAPEVLKQVKAGTVTMPQAIRAIKEEKREQKRQENAQKIEGVKNPRELLGAVKFPTIVIDPPWDWGDEGDKDQMGRSRPDYSTMSLSELLKFPIPELSDDDCHIYLWITNRSLPKGFQLLEAWGFRYITCLTWVKPSFGLGNYFRGQTEQVLFGVKGSQALKRKDVGTVFHAKRGDGGHSSKPDEFFDLVEKCSPAPYLEVFSRKQRKNWTAWGEISND